MTRPSKRHPHWHPAPCASAKPQPSPVTRFIFEVAMHPPQQQHIDHRHGLGHPPKMPPRLIGRQPHPHQSSPSEEQGYAQKYPLTASQCRSGGQDIGIHTWVLAVLCRHGAGVAPRVHADAASDFQVWITLSGLSEMELMPFWANHKAKSAWSLGPWPQMPTYLPAA